ncbi:MAG: hypothetical protein LCH46_02520 [Proteobacteria bacterium]|nr:hypothetical protein [Pseudomonadota bacterium]
MTGAAEAMDYRTALIEAIEGEIAGEAYFEALAESHSGPAREALLLMAGVERAVTAAVWPLVGRHELPIADTETLRGQGRDSARKDGAMAWQDFLRDVETGYQKYVVAYEQIALQASAGDRALARLLPDHEVAFIAFARAEMRDGSGADILRDFIRRADALHRPEAR